MQTKNPFIKFSAPKEQSITLYYQQPVSDGQSCESALWRISTLFSGCEDALICAESLYSAVHTAH